MVRATCIPLRSPMQRLDGFHCSSRWRRWWTWVIKRRFRLPRTLCVAAMTVHDLARPPTPLSAPKNPATEGIFSTGDLARDAHTPTRDLARKTGKSRKSAQENKTSPQEKHKKNREGAVPNLKNKKTVIVPVLFDKTEKGHERSSNGYSAQEPRKKKEESRKTPEITPERRRETPARTPERKRETPAGFLKENIPSEVPPRRPKRVNTCCEVIKEKCLGVLCAGTKNAITVAGKPRRSFYKKVLWPK